MLAVGVCVHACTVAHCFFSGWKLSERVSGKWLAVVVVCAVVMVRQMKLELDKRGGLVRP
jgi:hypothetical protein